jgi:SAM-dependent methyltransferase
LGALWCAFQVIGAEAGLNLDTFRWLLSPPGQALLREAVRGDLREGERLRTLTQLRKQATAEQAAAAYEMAWLRQRATGKFTRASQMYFTREALEQASGERIARYRAERFAAFERVGDFCCGIGGDTLGLAQHSYICAVELDMLRLAMAHENAIAHGVQSRVEFIQADLTLLALPRVQAIFFDPARRAAGKRLFRLADYVPPVSLVRAWRKHVQLVGVKVAPGISDADIVALGEVEVEFISVDGELKEAVLWFGEDIRPGRHATLLTGNQRHTPQATHQATRSIPKPPLSQPLAYLYEPDPAIIRAHQVQALANELDAAQLDEAIAYLTSVQLTHTPLARCWRVLDWFPFQLKNLRARLRNLDVGAVTVKKRGSPLDADVLARQLSGSGSRPLVVVLTQFINKPIALICEGPILPT